MPLHLHISETLSAGGFIFVLSESMEHDLLNSCPNRPIIPPTVRSKEANMAETRKVLDCRRFPAEKPCSIAISGTVDEVVELGVLHATTVHGHQDTPELREQLRSMLQDDNAAIAEAA
jgi:hypothetical protein